MHGESVDTYWLGFELKWRDFFRFFALKHGATAGRVALLATSGSSAAVTDPRERIEEVLAAGKAAADDAFQVLPPFEMMVQRHRRVCVSP